MKKIILVGGVAGTGKTSIARRICQEYDIDHRIGTGFIREIVRCETKDKILNCHTYRVDCDNPYNHLVKQAELMKESINACINRAHKEGTSLVIEGNHCLPWILENKNVTSAFILCVNDSRQHYEMVTGDTHKHRKMTEDEFGRIREMQEAIIFLAGKYNIPLVEFNDIKYVVDKLIV